MIRAVLLIGGLLGLASHAEARQTADQIARAIVIGQVYASGNVYVAGFDANETRAWPDRLSLVPLRGASTQPLFADFVRLVAQDSEEQYYFPQREDRDPAVADVFSTIDRAALEDRNLARYRSADLQNTPMSILAWDERLGIRDISVRDSGQPRPTTAPERAETPGCAGHLSDIYILDVLEPGQEQRRFEFRHDQGVL